MKQLVFTTKSYSHCSSGTGPNEKLGGGRKAGTDSCYNSRFSFFHPVALRTSCKKWRSAEAKFHLIFFSSVYIQIPTVQLISPKQVIGVQWVMFVLESCCVLTTVNVGWALTTSYRSNVLWILSWGSLKAYIDLGSSPV